MTFTDSAESHVWFNMEERTVFRRTPDDTSSSPSTSPHTVCEKKKTFHDLWESCLRTGFFTPVRGRWGRCVGWPPDWGGLAGGPDPLRGHTSGCVWCGERLVVVPA